MHAFDNQLNSRLGIDGIASQTSPGSGAVQTDEGRVHTHDDIGGRIVRAWTVDMVQEQDIRAPIKPRVPGAHKKNTRHGAIEGGLAVIPFHQLAWGQSSRE